MNESIQKQIIELREIAKAYQLKLAESQINTHENKLTQLIANLNDSLCFLNESMPKLISIQNQINEQKNHSNKDHVR